MPAPFVPPPKPKPEDDSECEPQPTEQTPAAHFALPDAWLQAIEKGLENRLPLSLTLQELRGMNPYPVLPCNAPALELFLTMATQWNRNGMDGSRESLKYESIATCERMSGITATPKIMDDLRDLEAAVILEDARLARERQKTQP
jgi:hypothetical protein